MDRFVVSTNINGTARISRYDDKGKEWGFWNVDLDEAKAFSAVLDFWIEDATREAHDEQMASTES